MKFYHDRCLIHISAALLYVVCLGIWNYLWVKGYWVGNTPYPFLWKVIAISLLVIFSYLYILLPLRIVQRFFNILSKNKVFHLVATVYDNYLWLFWFALLMFSLSTTVVVQKFYPGLPPYLIGGEGSIVCLSGQKLLIEATLEEKTMKGYVAPKRGEIHFGIHNDSKKWFTEGEGFSARVRGDMVTWGKKLHSVGVGNMWRKAHVKIDLQIPEFEAPQPVRVIGKAWGITATYPTTKGVKGGFYNATSRLGTKPIELYIFPQKMGGVYHRRVHNQPPWWHFPLFILLSLMVPRWVYLRAKVLR